MNKLNENEVQIHKRISDILNNNSTPNNSINEITFKTNRTEIIHKNESNYAFLILISPLLKGNKVLDLFCGTNSIKQFSAQNHLNAVITGVDNDIDNTNADVKSDVSNLPNIITPDKQFDIITSFGGTESEDYFNDYNYLTDDGLLIHGYSDSYFKDNDIKKQLTSGKKIELLRCFNPVVIVNIQGIHQKIDWPDQKKPLDFSSTMVYVIFQKKPIN